MSDRRIHGLDAAGGGDVAPVDDDDVLGPCPSCGAELRVFTHPIPFCTYFGETDPATIEDDVRRLS